MELLKIMILKHLLLRLIVIMYLSRHVESWRLRTLQYIQVILVVIVVLAEMLIILNIRTLLRNI